MEILLEKRASDEAEEDRKRKSEDDPKLELFRAIHGGNGTAEDKKTLFRKKTLRQNSKQKLPNPRKYVKRNSFDPHLLKETSNLKREPTHLPPIQKRRTALNVHVHHPERVSTIP